MPSNGLHPFLPHVARVALVTVLCQCPQTGYIHFYLWNYRWYGVQHAVSMPSNGLHPFLHIMYKKRKYFEYCVNALKRATSISTKEEQVFYGELADVSMPSNGLHPFLRYPSATPVKSRLCRGILVNNSQNILISSIFALFFWLFNSALWYYDIMEKSNIIYPNFTPIK